MTVRRTAENYRRRRQDKSDREWAEWEELWGMEEANWCLYYCLPNALLDASQTNICHERPPQCARVKARVKRLAIFPWVYLCQTFLQTGSVGIPASLPSYFLILIARRFL